MRIQFGFMCFFMSVACSSLEPSDLASLSNLQPISDAGINGQGSTSAPIVLDGSNSYDPEGDQLTYHWSFHLVPESSSYATSETADFSYNNGIKSKTSFFPDVEGTYIIDLIVKDSLGESSKVDNVVYVVEGGLLPVADAGQDQYLYVGDRLELSAENSFDPFGRELNFNWSLVLSF